MATNIAVADVKIGDVITLTAHGTNALPNIIDAEVLSITSGTALRSPVDASTAHANVYPTLPQNVKELFRDDFQSYNYLVLRRSDDTIVEYGFPWIVTSTLTRKDRKTGTVTIRDFDSSVETSVREFLAVRGLDFEISIA